MIAGEQHAYASLSAVVARAYLVKLRDGAASVFGLAEFQISLCQQVEILRAVGMLLDLFDQFGLVELSPGLGSEVGAVVQIFKKMLIRIGSRAKNLWRESGTRSNPFVPPRSDAGSSRPWRACSIRKQGRG